MVPGTFEAGGPTQSLRPWPLSLSARAAISRCSRLDDFNKNLFSDISGGWECETKLLAVLVSIKARNLSLACVSALKKEECQQKNTMFLRCPLEQERPGLECLCDCYLAGLCLFSG